MNHPDQRRELFAHDILLAVWSLGALCQFVYLMATDWPALTWYNWPVLAGINLFLAPFWPLHWLVFVPVRFLMTGH